MKALEKFVNDLNRKGIPLPVARDPATGKGSATFTAFVVSFGAAVILLSGKIRDFIGETDYNNVLWLLGLTFGAYIGRRVQKKGDEISIDGEEVKTKVEKEDADLSK